MAVNLELKIPATTESFYDDSDKSANRSVLDTIMSNYGTYINNSATISNVPAEFIQSFIFIESRGKSDAVSGKAVGLMQVGTNSATDIIIMENTNKDLSGKNCLTDGEKDVLRQYLGDRLDTILGFKRGDPTLVVTKADLLNPELNICIGTIYLSLLMNKVIRYKGKLQMEFVVAGYNMGYYAALKLMPKSVDSLMASLNSTSRDYVLKLVGTNGLLETLIS